MEFQVPGSFKRVLGSFGDVSGVFRRLELALIHGSLRCLQRVRERSRSVPWGFEGVL